MRAKHPPIPAGLARASLEVLVGPALLAPVPLFWTQGASPVAVVLYECALVFLWWRARRGNLVRLPDWMLNAAGAAYLLWLAFETSMLKPGLLQSVSHLLLFTAVAKLASLKRPGEVRTALLVVFLIALAAASSATHVSSLLYFAAMGLVSLRALARLAVLADFDDAPPRRVLSAVPTRGMAAGTLAAAALLAVPLFYALPRLRSPFVVPRVHLEEAFATALAADRVDLESFGAAKRSDRVVLTMDVEPVASRARVLRMREAVFTDYRGGVWTRRRSAKRREATRERETREPPASPAERARQLLVAQVSVNLASSANGFLFLPYGAEDLRLEGEPVVALPDGVMRSSGGRRSIRYDVGVRGLDPRGPGSSAIDPQSVPPEIREYARKLTGDLSDPDQIYQRIREHLARDFLYTLEPPRGPGDPLVNFLTHSRAGHCEFFASAAAMMLTARGIPARLVTGSYGGEIGLLSRALVVRAANLHAWVEADLDGRGFVMLDPTPPSGIPAGETRHSWRRLFENLGREFELFYDRRILGFDTLDQAQIMESFREALGNAARSVGAWRQLARGRELAATGMVLAALALLGAFAFALRRLERRVSLPAATKAYLALRRLLARRLGSLAPSVPPLEVARLFGQSAPQAREDASAVASLYCASAFGGRTLDLQAERELSERIKRLKKLA